MCSGCKCRPLNMQCSCSVYSVYIDSMQYQNMEFISYQYGDSSSPRLMRCFCNGDGDFRSVYVFSTVQSRCRSDSVNDLKNI